MKKFIFAAAVIALAACSREPAATDSVSREIRFTSNIENTFALKSLDPLAVGKTVRIFAGAPIDANTEATAAAGNVLTPATALKWKAGQTAKTTFVGLYPADQMQTLVTNYSLADENGTQDFEYHSNLLAASAKDVQPGSVVNLTFRHPFVKLVINIDNQLDGTPEVDGASVGEVVTEASLDFAAGTSTPAAYKGSVKATKNVASGKFEAIIMPQSAAKPVITLTVGAASYIFRINDATDFVAGKAYTASLTLKSNAPAEGEAVSFGFTINDWEAEATPLETTDITEQWSVVGNVTGGWDNDLVLTEGETSGVLEATILYSEGDEFKLRKAGNWAVSAGMKDGVSYVGDASWDGHLAETSNNIKLQSAGRYIITFRPEDWLFTATLIL